MTTTFAQRAHTVVAFARPHTIVGTTVSVTVLALLSHVLAGPPSPGAGRVVAAFVAALAVNLYIVGLNQLTDVAIDRVNKPWLPLPAGLLSVAGGRGLVGGALAVAVVAGALGSGWLLTAILIGAAVGTAYSAEPVRLKRHHLPAALAIAGVRGLVVNLLVYAHFATAGGRPLSLPAAVIALAGVVTVHAVIIAWFKDIPDSEGDAAHHVATLTLRLGPSSVLRIGVVALLAAYAAVALTAAVGVTGLNDAVLGVGHVLLAAGLLAAASRIDLDDRTTVVRFYQRIWHLFSAGYLVFAVAALV